MYNIALGDYHSTEFNICAMQIMAMRSKETCSYRTCTAPFGNVVVLGHRKLLSLLTFKTYMIV